MVYGTLVKTISQILLYKFVQIHSLITPTRSKIEQSWITNLRSNEVV